MFSVVIPTMWLYEPFLEFIDDLRSNQFVSEIIIIDNNTAARPQSEILSRTKIRLIPQAENIFVNPAWNLGIYYAKNEKICVLNDDVLFDLRLFKKMFALMEEEDFGVAGAHPGETKFFQTPFVDGNIDIKPWESPLPGKSDGYLFGFGTLFFVNKSKWIRIPDRLSIYYGDDWVHLTQDTFDRKIYLITNMFYSSPSAQTCTKILDQEEREIILEKEGEIYREEVAIFRDKAYQGYIESEYELACNTITDVHEHIPVLRQLSSECERVVELGVREGWSTRAFLTQRNRLRSYDIVMWPYVQHLFNTMRNVGRDFEYIHADSLEIELEECDMIFFDTEHTYDQLSKELHLHGNKASKYLVFHDTVSYDKALIPAIEEFLVLNPHWKIKHHYTNNNGLLILERDLND